MFEIYKLSRLKKKHPECDDMEDKLDACDDNIVRIVKNILKSARDDLRNGVCQLKEGKTVRLKLQGVPGCTLLFPLLFPAPFHIQKYFYDERLALAQTQNTSPKEKHCAKPHTPPTYHTNI